MNKHIILISSLRTTHHLLLDRIALLNISPRFLPGWPRQGHSC